MKGMKRPRSPRTVKEAEASLCGRSEDDATDTALSRQGECSPKSPRLINPLLGWILL
jgi:hypothetical protein